MKYRELTQNEIEAYNVGYKNGSRQCVIKILEFESPEEKKLYRQGYNAGCQDRKRHNVSTCEISGNVSNVSNVKPYDSCVSTIANTITNTIVDIKDSNKGGSGGKEKEKNQIDWDDVLDRWNRIAKKYCLAVIKVLTEDRKKRFKARLEENKITQVQFFDVVNKAIGTSSFLQGYEIQFESDGTPNKVSQNWKADFDFCLQSSSFARMSENFYSRRSPELLKQWESMENANKN